MQKPCYRDHGEYREGCTLCRRWRDDPAFAVFHAMPEGGKASTPKAKAVPENGIHTRIAKRGCKKTCQWNWEVYRDGLLIERGEEDTEAAARREADEVAQSLTGSARIA